MLELHSTRGVEFCDGLTRRDFLRVGALSAGAVGLSLTDLLPSAQAAPRGQATSCILLFLVGGPSHLDTWDLKPQAPDSVRGPFRPMHTTVPGITMSEHFPLMARQAQRYALVRSVHHDAAPIHETGHQLMQTGRLGHAGVEYPHYGAVLSHLRGPSAPGVPAWAVLPAPIHNTGVSVGHGQTAGYLGRQHDPLYIQGDPAQPHAHYQFLDALDAAQRSVESAPEANAQARALDRLFAPTTKKALDTSGEKEITRSRYGVNTFGQSCLLARRLVERGVGLVTVNMFDSVFNEITWDCHADGGALATDLDDYKEVLCPLFDRAYSALLEDLAERGMLDSTLVVAMGEFGRTPQINPRGGRDHWPGCWSIVLAGGGIKGGQVVGSSDRTGSEPKDRPVTPADVAATIYHALGVQPAISLPGPDGTPLPVSTGKPIAELFA